MDRGAWWAATFHRVEKSQTQLNDFHFHFVIKQYKEEAKEKMKV